MTTTTASASPTSLVLPTAAQLRADRGGAPNLDRPVVHTASGGELPSPPVGLFGRRKAAEQALSEAQAECQALRSRLGTATSERDELVAERDLLRQERDDLHATVKRQDDELAAATAAAEAAAAREAVRTQALVEGEPGPSWPLLLADMERRWANTVGVPPSARAMKATEVAGQLAETLDREVERVREEVGVDVSLTLTNEVDTGMPVVFLLAATDLLGALVSTCERVTLELDGKLVLLGEVWSELGDEIDVARQRAVAAGLEVEPVEVDTERVRVTMLP
jgi:hypothetical protein